MIGPTLNPALADLIRALAEDAVARGYLSPEPANDGGSDANRTERVSLPAHDQAA